MTPTHIGKHVATLLVEATRLERALVQHEFDIELRHAREAGVGAPNWIFEREVELRQPFSDVLESLYLALVYLCDVNGCGAYLKQCYERFGERFSASDAAEKFEADPYTIETHSVVLRDLRTFLAPFGVSDISEEQFHRQAGIQYLETVLANTAAIVHQFKIQPASETDVSHSVREFLKLIFTSARNPPAARFIKTLKSYKPDILIPELGVAIEYKYIETEVKLKAVLGEISEDVKGYSGDLEYRLFYAVFYLTHDFWGAKRYREAWDEFGFPVNWIPFFVVSGR